MARRYRAGEGLAMRRAMSAGPPATLSDDTDPGEGTQPLVIVRPVVNAIRIMRLLAGTERALTATEIAQSLGINRSTCFNILKTLTCENAIEFDARSKTYDLALGHQHWQAGVISEQQRMDAARRLMRSLSAQFSVTVSLWQRVGRDRLVLVAVEHSDSALRIHLTEGQRVPILMGSSGRALAGHLGLSKAAMQEDFRKLRWQQPVSFREFCADVERASASGYGIDEGHYARGVTSVGAAVLDRHRQPRYSVTAVMFQGQFDAPRLDEVGRALKALGEDLAQVLT